MAKLSSFKVGDKVFRKIWKSIDGYEDEPYETILETGRRDFTLVDSYHGCIRYPVDEGDDWEIYQESNKNGQ